MTAPADLELPKRSGLGFGLMSVSLGRRASLELNTGGVFQEAFRRALLQKGGSPASTRCAGVVHSV